MNIWKSNIWWIWQRNQNIPAKSNSFCLVIKEIIGLVLSWWTTMHFLFTYSRHFFSSAAFSWSNWEQYLSKLIICFPEPHNRRLSSSPTYTQPHLLWLKTGLCSSWQFISHAHNFFHSTLLYSFHFSSPVTICFRNGTFSLHLSRELHVEIWSRFFFSHLAYEEPKLQSD